MLSHDITSQAMLIHHHEKTGRVTITTHAVKEIDKGKGFTLGAGRAFSTHDKQALVELLLNEEPALEFLPNNLLARGRGCLAWYRPAQLAQLPFPKEIITTPLPGLIFVAMDGKPLRCFAYAQTARPGPDTPLCYVPLGNVYQDGSFCTGNVELPTEILNEHIPVWERFVLESTNTHEGSIQPVQGCENFAAMLVFYRDLAHAGESIFPVERLVPVLHQGAAVTLQSILRKHH